MEVESKVVLPRELDDLSSFIQEKPESLAAATAELQAIALRATKFLFDLGKYIRFKICTQYSAEQSYSFAVGTCIYTSYSGPSFFSHTVSSSQDEITNSC